MIRKIILTPKKLNLINAIVAQAAWWMCVLSAKDSPVVIPLVATAFVFAVHFKLICTNVKRDLIVFAVFTVYGSILDSAFIASGIYIMPDGSMWAPVWLICLWAIYATNLEYSLHWVAKNPWLGAALGAFFGPVSYAAGATFNLLIFREPKLESIIFTSLMWALSTPFVYWVLKLKKRSA